MRAGLEAGIGANDSWIADFARQFLRAKKELIQCLLIAAMHSPGVLTAQDSSSTPVEVAKARVSRLTLELNIPAFRLDVRRDSLVIRSYVVAVGMRRYATPVGTFQVSSIVWNPSWTPPDAPWAANDTATGPGPRNPMGKVKLQFHALYYLHGTPAISSLGKAASHGCVRMHNDDAAELARLVQGSLDIHAPFMDSVTRSWNQTREVRLPTLVPLNIVYEPVELRDSMLVIHPDVYRRSGADEVEPIIQALLRGGIDTTGISLHEIGQMAKRARTKVVRVPIRSVQKTP